MKKVLYGIFAISALGDFCVGCTCTGGRSGRVGSNVGFGGEFLRDQRQHRKLGGGCRARGNRWR